MDDDLQQDRFLAIDRLSDSRRADAYAQLRMGQAWIQSVPIRENGHTVSVPAGLIHHWVGAVFVNGASLADVLAILHDYDHHKEIYRPRMRQSKLVGQTGDESKVRLQLYNKSVVTVFLNADFDVTDSQYGELRHQIALRSTRIAEVSNAETASESELPVGNDHGYLWRFRSYWRLEEKDGGVYLQNESLALTRSLPGLFAWLFNPFVKDLPRDILLHLLTDTRDAVARRSTGSTGLLRSLQ